MPGAAIWHARKVPVRLVSRILLPILFGALECGDLLRCSGRVHQNVDLAERAYCLRIEVFERAAIEHIRAELERAPPLGHESPGRLQRLQRFCANWPLHRLRLRRARWQSRGRFRRCLRRPARHGRSGRICPALCLLSSPGDLTACGVQNRRDVEVEEAVRVGIEADVGVGLAFGWGA
jgi:hypothetical protein